MNILEICLGPDLGGLELYFHRCCVELGKLGHPVISVRLAGSRLDELAKKDRIETYHFTRGNKLLPVGPAKKLAKLIDEHGIDIVHGHTKDDLALLALAKGFSKRPVKVIFTRQMPMPHKKKDLYHRWVYSKIDRFLTITEKLKKDALENLPIDADKIERLYYGVSAPAPADPIYLQQFLTLSQPGDFNIGVFSRVEFQKGQHLVVEAFTKLIARGVPGKLYVVGHVMDPSYQQSLEQQVKDSGVENRVAFKGFLAEPVKAMQGMDVLILPSRHEAFGLVLIEAMRCGICVLGVNAGGVPEIIDHQETGLLFDWGNADQLADELEYLYRNADKRNELARRGKQKADEQFNSELHFQSLQKIFITVLSL